MTMHLVGPYLTTTSYKKRKMKITKTALANYQMEHKDYNRRLKQAGRHSEQLTLEQYIDYRCGKLKLNKQEPKFVPYSGPKQGYRRETPDIPSHGTGVGTAVRAPDKVYTGDKIKGIGTMHKSNAVPIFSDEQAVAISKMRR